MALILAIDTSCDETSAAVVDGQRILSSVVYSQILIHKQWGGVVPNLAKRAHVERLDSVVANALKKYNSIAKVTDWNGSPEYVEKIMHSLDAVAVTYGPGLAVALEAGIVKAKELSNRYHKPLIGVNHMEGHIYSVFMQNRNGNPERPFQFPYLALLVSGGHTELIHMKGHRTYELLGETVDDAGGEALDKAAKMLGLGYPGGPVIEQLAQEVHNEDRYRFPRPMAKSKDYQFSFSGLKTSFLYFLREMGEEEKNKNLRYLASSFQEAVFDSILLKTERAMKEKGLNRILVGGGVSANRYLRKRFRRLVRQYQGEVLFPSFSYLTGDNAAMIGAVGSIMFEQKQFMKDPDALEREPRLLVASSA
ncbi:tRNA (adenosine(37)-N6)-threonylcarbamoyltransferase complex transferase subunit TsaD [Candidatus Roizmanbacteria bacterium]|nr:tRNA (adenosine(37)-N6)-threonylcarbamoyltransferase complex transferase subunit TsaD [Candidatus Roizmanbacteria bacterium]